VMEVRVECLANGFNALESLLCKHVPKLAANKFKTLAIFLAGGLIRSSKCAIEGIEYGKNVLHEHLGPTTTLCVPFLLDPLLKILEVCLAPNERVHQILFLCEKLLNLLRERCIFTWTGGFGVRRRPALCSDAPRSVFFLDFLFP